MKSFGTYLHGTKMAGWQIYVFVILGHSVTYHLQRQGYSTEAINLTSIVLLECICCTWSIKRVWTIHLLGVNQSAGADYLYSK